jgi:hypothetical protein
MLDGCTLATPPAEFIITKINTSTKKNTEREVKGVRRKQEWIRGMREKDKERGNEGRDYY